MEKSENQSENYRKSQAFSTVVDADDDDNVKSSSVVVSIDTIEKWWKWLKINPKNSRILKCHYHLYRFSWSVSMIFGDWKSQ